MEVTRPSSTRTNAASPVSAVSYFDVESEVGKGSTFFAMLTAVPGAAGCPGAEQ